MMINRTLLKVLLVVIAVFALVVGNISATPAADKPIILRHSTHGALNKYNPGRLIIKEYGDELEKRTNGRVKFEYFWNESLAKAMDAPEALRTGVCDTAMVVTVYYPAKFPAWTVVDIAGPIDTYAIAKAMWDLYDTEPSFKNDLDKNNAHPLLMIPLGETIAAFRKKVTCVEDFKGMKIRAVGSEADFINGLGGVSVPIPHPEVYTALQRGTIDGCIGFPFTAMAYGYYDVTPYWLRGIPGNFALMILINKDSWKKIPKDIQEMMMDMGRGYVRRYANEMFRVDESVVKTRQAAGTTITSLSAADYKAWMDQYKPLYVKWEKEMDKKGIPGAKILKKYFELYKKYEVKY